MIMQSQLDDLYYKDTCFHVISSASKHIIYFLRDSNIYPMTHEELSLYIDHALGDTFIIDHYKLKIQNPHLSTYIKPVIETLYFGQDDKMTKIKLFTDLLTSFVKPNDMIVDLIDYPININYPGDEYMLFCYNNTHTNMFTLVSNPHKQDYFSHFKLEWKLTCTRDTLKLIFNNDHIIRTTDECLINAYKMFAEQLQKQQKLRGYDGGYDVMYVDGMPAVGGRWEPKDNNSIMKNNKNGTYKMYINTRDMSELKPITITPKYKHSIPDSDNTTTSSQ